MHLYDIIFVQDKKITGVSLTLPELKKESYLYNPRKKMLIISNKKLYDTELEIIKEEGEKLLWQEKNQKRKRR